MTIRHIDRGDVLSLSSSPRIPAENDKSASGVVQIWSEVEHLNEYAPVQGQRYLDGLECPNVKIDLLRFDT